MDESTSAVSAAPGGDSAGVDATTQAPSASAEETSNVSAEASEKTKISQGEAVEGADSGESEKSVPYSRLKEKVDAYNELETNASSWKEKAELMDKLQSDPELARAFLSNAKPAEEVNPIRQRADEQLKEMGYVKAEEVEAKVDELFNRRELQRAFVDKVGALEKQYDGSDGGPKFEAKAVADYMDKHGFTSDANGYPDVEAAFKYMNMDSFIDSKAKQNTSTTFSEKPGTPRGRQGSDDSQARLDEAKKTGNWGDYLKNRIPYPGK